MRFQKTKSTTFFDKIGLYYDCQCKALVFLYKERRWYIFFSTNEQNTEIKKESIKDRALLAWDKAYPTLLIILIAPIIIAFIISFLVIAIIDVYVICIVYFIIWIISGDKHYRYITKKMGNLLWTLVNKIKIDRL